MLVRSRARPPDFLANLLLPPAAHDRAQATASHWSGIDHEPDIGRHDKIDAIDLSRKSLSNASSLGKPGLVLKPMRRLIDVVASGRVDLAPMVTHRFTLDRIEEAYELFSHQRGGVLKVAITI